MIDAVLALIFFCSLLLIVSGLASSGRRRHDREITLSQYWRLHELHTHEEREEQHR